MNRTQPTTESVLVLGCTGVLGSQLSRALLAKGQRVVGLVHTPRAESAFIRDRLFDHVHVVRGNIRNTDQLAQFLAIHEITTVYQCASVPGSPQETLELTHKTLSAVASGQPQGVVVVPLAATMPTPTFRTNPFSGIRVAFVRTSASIDSNTLVNALIEGAEKVATIHPIPATGLWLNSDTTMTPRVAA